MGRFPLPRFPWAAVAAVGLCAGALVVFAEWFGEPGAAVTPPARLISLVLVYLGLETAGLLIGYCLLRKPLGLRVGSSRDPSRHQAAPVSRSA